MFGLRINGLLLLCVALTILAYAQTPPPGRLPPTELNQARNTVQTFCTFWKALKFDSIYMVVTEEIRTDMNRAPFLNIYGILNDNSGKLISFAVTEAIPNEHEIMERTQLAFNKIIAPTMINGVHNFYLVKEAGKWKVKAIVPPIVPPAPGGSGGSHPGE